MPVFRALAVSIFFHIFLYMGLVHWLSLPPYYDFPKKIQPIEIIVNNEQNQKPIENQEHLRLVRQTDIPQNEQSANQDPARFWSLNNQRVKQETQAQESGLSKNRSTEIAPTPQIKSRPFQVPENPKFENEVDQSPTIITHRRKLTPDFIPNKIQVSKEDIQPNHRFEEKGISTVGEFLPENVKIGSFTALNTDRHLFYSFYARIEELIRYRWENTIRNEIERLSSRGFRGAGRQDDWITHIDIYLSSSGRFETASIDRPSGINGFDYAAITAFKEANFFPNPPKEMVEANGKIHLSYSFHVKWRPGPVVTNR